MVLEKYKQKRNFTSTPEPSGDVTLAATLAKKKPKEGLFFCVQKHLASHLHYDFRLEYKGVLLSWAVPKGPSLDPKTKRLAMHVEDHPIEYGTFEGVIPSGYGAGIVMLWDQGTWTPESDDVDAALKKGDLKFTLDGYKLKGSWVLVRTGGRWGGGRGGSDARSWLLIKHRDDWAGDVDITEFAPRSVKSDGDFEDILAADNPDVWESNRPASGGDAGAMLKKIIERAAALKAGKSATPPHTPRPPRPRTKSTKTTKVTKKATKSAAPAARASGRRAAPRSGARERAASGGGAPRALRNADKLASVRKAKSAPKRSPKGRSGS
jgi:bifunctional non-homologous end joining protein LigD